jgi:hypothetical protein
MRGLTKACLICAAAIACAPVHARADGYVTPWIGAGGLSATDAGRSTFGVTTGYMAAGVFGFEGDFGYAPDFFGLNELGKSTAITASGNFILGVPIGGTDGAGVRPFVTGGLGLIRTHIENDVLDASRTNNGVGYNVGAGMMGFFSHHVGLRGDVRYLRLLEDTNLGPGVAFDPGKVRYWRVSAGMTFR